MRLIARRRVVKRVLVCGCGSSTSETTSDQLTDLRWWPRAHAHGAGCSLNGAAHTHQNAAKLARQTAELEPKEVRLKKYVVWEGRRVVQASGGVGQVMRTR